LVVQTQTKDLKMKLNFRNIAESLWGTGGTSAYRTNTKGAYYYSCSGHGGFIIDGRILNDFQKEKLDKYGSKGKATIFKDNLGEIRAFHHPWKRTSTHYSYSWTEEEFDIYVLEEDCDWCLAYMFTPIRVKSAFNHTEEEMLTYARSCFYDCFDETNPKITHSKEVALKREKGDSDLIISAISTGDNQTKVTTADDKDHLVNDYSNARDAYGTPWLHLCANVQTLTTGEA
jgi:hypothetical protein